MNFETFKKLTDHISAAPLDPATQSELDFTTLYEILRGLLGGPKHQIRAQIFSLIDECTIRQEYYGEDVTIYLALARTFFDATNMSNIESGYADWQRAIGLTLSNRDQLGIFFDSPLSQVNPLPKFIARCATGLRERGYLIDFAGSQPVYSEMFTKAFNQEINDLCEDLGGVYILNCLLNTISDYYQDELGRYVLPQSQIPAPSLEVDVPIPILPLTYLMHLGIKHADKKPQQLENAVANHKWHRLIELVIYSVGTLGLQPVGRFDGIILDAFSIWHYIGRMTRFEALCYPSQLSVNQYLRFTKAIIEYYQKEYGKQPVLVDLYRITEAILELAPHTRPSIVDINAVARKTNSTIAEIRTGLDLLQEPQLPSLDCIDFEPNSAEKNFGLFPLVKLPSDQWLLVSKEFSTPAMLEAIYTEGRKIDADFDGRIGNAADSFLKAAFEEKGFAAQTGTYTGGGKNALSDCDVIVETNACIYSFEIKKKGLVKESLGGDPQSIFIDIVKGLVKAQIQALTHELQLRRAGYIDLKTMTGMYRLALKHRAFKRISLTWSEIGFLHSKSIAIKFIEIFDAIAMASSHPDEEIRKKFDSLAKEKQTLTKLLNALHSEFGIDRRQSLFAGRFLSLPIILTILDLSTDLGHFVKMLDMAENLITGNRDLS